jgi:hypothetical chaperone protein
MSERLNEYFGARAKYKVPMGRNLLTMPPSIMDRLNKPSQISHLREKDTYEFIRDIRRGTLDKHDRENIDRLFLLIEDQQIFSFFEAIEKTKRELSTTSIAPFYFDYPGIEIEAPFSRIEFENWALNIKRDIFAALDSCLNQGGIKSSDIDLVFLTGGSARVPLISRELEIRFGMEKLQTQSHFHSVLSGLIEACENFEPI